MDVFRRREMKYLMTPRQYEGLLEDISHRLVYDDFHRDGKSVTICNVYYDTPHDILIRASLDKPMYKEKIRLRAYGVPAMEDNVYVEIKKKVDGIVGKRRISLALAEAQAYLRGEYLPELQGREGQIDREIRQFLARYAISPAVYIAYDRVAWYGREDDGLRVTFDRNIRTRRDRLSLADGDEGETLLSNGEILMEIKAQGGMPLWLARALSEHQIRRVSFSKYGAEFKRKIQREKEDACFRPSLRQIRQPIPSRYPPAMSLRQSVQRSS